MSADSASPRVLGLGIACLDYLFVAELAADGGQGPLADYVEEGGGLVATGLVAAARLGAQTEIWTWVGDDAAGETVLAGLRREGVGVEGVETVAGAGTPISFVRVAPGSGERTIYHKGGPRLSPAQVESLAGRDVACDVVLVDATWPEASAALARRAREAAIGVVGDFCPTEARRDLAAMVSALICPRACAERIAPGASRREQLDALRGLGPAFVAITGGSEGCWYLNGEEMLHQPAFAVEVVDTTGAGDAFHGAFAYALGRGWQGAQSIEFASAVAALSCRALGGRKAIPDLAETLAFLRRQGSERWRS